MHYFSKQPRNTRVSHNCSVWDHSMRTSCFSIGNLCKQHSLFLNPCKGPASSSDLRWAQPLTIRCFLDTSRPSLPIWELSSVKIFQSSWQCIGQYIQQLFSFLGLGVHMVILVPRQESVSCLPKINSNFHVVLTGVRRSCDRESNCSKIIF